MEAKELRIGNLIFDENRVIKEVEGISGKGSIHEEIRLIFFKDQQCSNFSRACNPIPLTEEWLLKFGFENDRITWSKDLILLSTFGDEFTVWVNTLTYGKLANPIKSVHQLQNLYYALTGEELKPL